MNITQKKEKAVNEIQKLREKIRYHNQKYYVEDNPEISDYDFDKLFEKLKQLEKDFPELITEDSPTQRVGTGEFTKFETVKHKAEMLSLDKSYNKDDLRDFDEKVREKLSKDQIEYVLEPKIDGLGVALYYEKKSFTRGSTRGDGAYGENITLNLKTIKSIPLKLSKTTNLETFEVRGEVFIPRNDFKKLNEDRIKNNEEPFANPRNAASGSVRRKNPREVAEVPLDIFIYSLSHNEGGNFQTHIEVLEELKKAGFKVNKYQKVKGINAISNSIDEWKEKKEKIDYEIDGLVIKVNNLKAHEILGSTTHHPRWAIAYKYPPNRKTTKLKNIKVSVGRTGKLTPVAIFEPIHLSGTEVSRASLHNEDEIKRKDIRIGDTVLIEKAGEIIPQLVKVIKEKRDGSERNFNMPDTCPVCGSQAKRFHGEVARRCINAQCPAQVKQRILHWGNRNAMNIDGLGPKLVDNLLKNDLVKNIADIYDLNRSQLKKMERMGKKSSQNLIDEINQSKNQSLEKVLFGLGINFVGSHVARILTRKYLSIADLMDADQQELEDMEEIGPKIAQSIVSFFKEEKNKSLINKLKEKGVKLKAKKQEFEEFLKEKKFVFTGALESYTREEASEQIRKFGGRVTTSVSGETDFVVRGENPGSKLEEAEKQNITILDENRFLQMLESKSIPQT